MSVIFRGVCGDCGRPDTMVISGGDFKPICNECGSTNMCMEGLLRDEERRILDILGNAYNLFNELYPIHSHDCAEFCRAIHMAQNIILSRPATEVDNILSKFTKGTI